MEYNINFTYKDNKQLKEIYKELLKRNGMTMTEASQLLGLSTPQQLNNKFNNKKVSLSDLKDFLGIMGYDYEIIRDLGAFEFFQISFTMQFLKHWKSLLFHFRIFFECPRKIFSFYATFQMALLRSATFYDS